MANTTKLSVLSARASAALALALPALVVMMPTAAHAEFSVGLDIRVGYAPPPMPIYDQPPIPGPDYIWVPGHWAWSDWIDDYYWVQGYWEQPPEPELLWTPAWWGWDEGAFRFHPGYWGREVGWYGGIDYGHGYHGHGWEGGRWERGHLAYNRAAVNVSNVRVSNVYYQQTTVVNNYGPRTSYSGGAGGVQARPTREELRATQGPHIAPTPAQQQRVQQAANNPRNVASHITPNWTPPPVHRVGTDGTPIPRSAALANGGATAGAPPQYQRHGNGTGPASGTGTGNGAPRPTGAYGAPPQPGAPGSPSAQRPACQNQAAPGSAASPRPTYGNGYATPPRQAPMNGNGYAPAPTQGYNPPPRQAPVNPNGYAPPPRPAPAPNTYHPPAPQPQPQFHAAPPPAPRPAPAPAPRPQPKEHDHQ